MSRLPGCCGPPRASCRSRRSCCSSPGSRCVRWRSRICFSTSRRGRRSWRGTACPGAISTRSPPPTTPTSTPPGSPRSAPRRSSRAVAFPPWSWPRRWSCCSPSRALTGSAGGGAPARWRARWRWRRRRSRGATASSSGHIFFRWPVRWRRWRRSTPLGNDEAMRRRPRAWRPGFLPPSSCGPTCTPGCSWRRCSSGRPRWRSRRSGATGWGRAGWPCWPRARRWRRWPRRWVGASFAICASTWCSRRSIRWTSSVRRPGSPTGRWGSTRSRSSRRPRSSSRSARGPRAVGRPSCWRRFCRSGFWPPIRSGSAPTSRWWRRRSWRWPRAWPRLV